LEVTNIASQIKNQITENHVHRFKSQHSG